MKKLTGVLIVVGMMVVGSVAVCAADDFKDTYEETEILTSELFEGISEVLSGETMQLGKLLTMIDTLVTNSQMLEKFSVELGKKEAADEAGQMAAYLTRIKQIIQTGQEQRTLVMLLARYYLHYNNCMMVNTLSLKEMQHDHVEELKAALETGDMSELEHLSEHLHVHSDQMYYAALIFGKKIWQKFSTQAKAYADEIFEAARSGDTAAVLAGVNKIEKPVAMLRKLVKR